MPESLAGLAIAWATILCALGGCSAVHARRPGLTKVRPAASPHELQGDLLEGVVHSRRLLNVEENLWAAAVVGDIEGVKEALRNGAAADVRMGFRGDTALTIAAANGHARVVSLILDAGAELEATNGDLVTGLWLASQGGHVNATKVLLTRGARVDATRRSDGSSALFEASLGGHAEVVEALLDAGANVEQGRRIDGATPLHAAAESGTGRGEKDPTGGTRKGVTSQKRGVGRNIALEVGDLAGYANVTSALLRAGANANRLRESDGATALFVAAGTVNLPLVNLLVNAGALVDATQKSTGSTPLVNAAMHGDASVVNALVAAGAEVDVVNDLGLTAMHEAARIGAADALRILIDAGADLEIRSRATGATPLVIAAGVKSTQKPMKSTPNVNGTMLGNASMVVNALIAAGADVNASDNLGHTALHVAARRGSPGVVGSLLAAGANVSAESRVGATPLFVGAAYGRIEVVNLLIKAGAKVNGARSFDGATAVLGASSKGHDVMVQVLVDANASVTKPDAFGTAPIHAACRNGHISVVDVLLEIRGDMRIDPNTRNAAGDAPLHLASLTIGRSSYQIASALIVAGAEINARGSNGSTPIMEAAFYGNFHVAQRLLDSGADVGLVNDDGQRAVDLVCGCEGSPDVWCPKGGCEKRSRRKKLKRLLGGKRQNTGPPCKDLMYCRRRLALYGEEVQG